MKSDEGIPERTCSLYIRHASPDHRGRRVSLIRTLFLDMERPRKVYEKALRRSSLEDVLKNVGDDDLYE